MKDIIVEYMQQEKQQYQKLHKKYQTALYMLKHNSDKDLDSCVLSEIYEKLIPTTCDAIDIDMITPNKYSIAQPFSTVKHYCKHTSQLKVAKLEDVYDSNHNHLDLNSLKINIDGNTDRVKKSVLSRLSDFDNSIENIASSIKEQESDYKFDGKHRYSFMFIGLIGLGFFYMLHGIPDFYSLLIGVFMLLWGITCHFEYNHSDKLYDLHTHYSHVSLKDFTKIIKNVDNRVIKQINNYDEILKDCQKELLPEKHIKAVNNGKYSWNQSSLAVKNKQNAEQDMKQPA